jgi:hypothetical protein
MIPQRTPLGHIVLIALPSVYLVATNMYEDNGSHLDYDDQIMTLWLGLFALASLVLHAVARWTSRPALSTQTRIAQWSAAAAQGIAVALAYGGGVNLDGRQLGLILAGIAVAIIGLYYGIVWLVRRFKKSRAPVSETEIETDETQPTTAPLTAPISAASSRLSQTLAVAATLVVFALSALASAFTDELFGWAPEVVHYFEGNAFIPIVPLALRSLMEIGIPVALVLTFRKRLLALDAQKILFMVAIAFLAAKGTLGSSLTSNIPLIWVSAQDAEELIAAELNTELYAMSLQNPDRLCRYAKTKMPDQVSMPEPNYHFNYGGATYAVFLSELNTTVRDLAVDSGRCKL